ncbi:hypothetical protein E2C06_34370 [Dankookia rubra]|uniref:GH16 domain-containing protein n=1 Tax=Dankookia rubra TaxID=1442381 RepID=A0A4R5Q5A7_9PROT|nr:glycoside hydrolase family 16 protein [Dankookia rubra]TDH58102.1 hypothetical protein E2C06_34370 [Dankookia rubra]
MTGPAAPGPASSVPAAPSAAAVSAWYGMTMTQPSVPPAPLPAGPAWQPGTVGGFAVGVPATRGPGAWAAPMTGQYAGTGPATTPLLDNPTRLPALPAAQDVPSTTVVPPRPVDDGAALAIAGYNPSLSPSVPPAQPGDERGLTVDEKRFVQGNPLLAAAYSDGQAVAPRLREAGYVAPAGDQGAKPGARLDGSSIQVTESFDRGLGLFSRSWGPGVDTSVAGQVTIRRMVQDGAEIDSGAMLPPTGATAGYGYGLYTFDLSMSGTAPGPYALLWPSTDVWPGPEMDLVERLDGGALYSTLHWDSDPGLASNADNAFTSIGLDGIDGSARHTYQYLWKPGRLTVFVDGQTLGSFTQNVPRAATDGGENAAPGIGMQTWWSAGQQAPCSGLCRENAITLYGFSYENLQ